MGTDTTDPDIAIGEAQDALDALTWGYCDPDAEVTTNCPVDQIDRDHQPLRSR